MDLELTGKRAAVAAASQGLGRAVATALAREGASVAIASRDERKIRAAADAIARETGARVFPVAADVLSEGDVKRFIAGAVESLGGLDILVTNAGGPPPGTFDQFDDAAWQKAYELNLLSVVRLVREAVPHLKKSGAGRIVNVTSTSVKQPIPRLILSNSIRAAVVGLAKTLSQELSPFGITVNNVAPGRIRTERVDQLDRAQAEREKKTVEEVRAATCREIPLGRLGTPEEFADAVAFLCSARARYITGVTLPVDGGRIAGV